MGKKVNFSGEEERVKCVSDTRQIDMFWGNICLHSSSDLPLCDYAGVS